MRFLADFIRGTTTSRTSYEGREEPSETPTGPSPGRASRQQPRSIETARAKVKRGIPLTSESRAVHSPPPRPRDVRLGAQVRERSLAVPLRVFALVVHEHAHAL